MRSLLLALHASEAISKASNYDQPGDAANMLQVEFFNRADLPSSEEIPCAEPGEEANMLQVGAYAVHGEQADEEGKHQLEQQVSQPFGQNQPPPNQHPPAQPQPLVEHPPTSTQATELDLNELISLNGVFRGMRVSKDVDSTRLNTVLEFGSALPSASQMLLNPDDSAQETSFQSKDHQRVKDYDKHVSTFGYKSAYSSSYTRTHSYVQPPRWWWWHGHSSNSNSEWEYSSDYESDWDWSHERETDTTTKTFTKVRYYVEPTAELVIDNSVLQPVASFVHAVDNMPGGDSRQEKKARAQAIDQIFDSYGSHVCTHVMFGGWWRIEANVQSTSEISTTEIDYAATTSISRTHQSSYDYGWRWNSWWWGGHSNQYSSQHESDWGWDREYERSSTETTSGQTVVVDTKQEWKGGESGAGAQQWRDSLRIGKKNWKVIERFPDDCLPVWNWVEDETKKGAMCSRWRDTLGADMGFNDVEYANLCSDGSLEMLLGVMETATANRCGHLDDKGVAGVTVNRAVPVSIASTDDECSQRCTADSKCVAWTREAETNQCWTPKEGMLAVVRFVVEEGKSSGLRCAQ